MNSKNKTFVIAEAGVNHNGSMEMALQLVDAAAQAGADAVKFQTFRADKLVSQGAPKAEYQLRTTDAAESQWEMIRKLELSPHDHERLIEHAKGKQIEFLSTPFDSESLQLLTRQFRMQTIKVSSGDITNAPFLLEIARSAPKIILSTGMSTLGEVEDALGVLAFGLTAPPDAAPDREAFITAFCSNEGRRALTKAVTVLHCTTEYPAPVSEVNLKAMDTLAAAFGLPVGYSDHTEGIHISLAAVARGAKVIEKHFTLDRNLEGPDHKASLEPAELTQLVNGIREINLALGDGIKQPSPSERKNRQVARRSLIALREVAQNQVFSSDSLSCKRPGSGISPMEYWNYLGKPASRSYHPDEALDG